MLAVYLRHSIRAGHGDGQTKGYCEVNSRQTTLAGTILYFTTETENSDHLFALDIPQQICELEIIQKRAS